jgi:hypothetical protein
VYLHQSSLIKPQSFFRACLREDGVLVPGSERIGHNVLTNFGREWLAELLSWKTVNDPDVANTNRRVRWIEVGDDSHAMVTEAVETLKSGVTITISPDNYLAQIDAPPTFVSPVWVKFSRTLSTTEVSHSGDVTIKEAGLCADLSPGIIENGTFDAWTADDPDGWNVSEAGTSEVTERGPLQDHAGGGTGACNLFTGVGPATIRQDILLTQNRDYVITLDVTNVTTANNIRILDYSTYSSFNQVYAISAVQQIVLPFTANGPLADFGIIGFGGGLDITIDNVRVDPVGQGVLNSSALNPVVAYKAFEGLLKSSGLTLDLEWSFLF